MEEQLATALSATLEPDVQTIRAAEQHLRQTLHVQPAAGLGLVRLVYADHQAVPLAVRQAAAVNLSIWIKQRWSPFFAEFVGFPQPDGPAIALAVDQKPPIRDALLNALTLSETKLRGPMLKALINVASCDWPDEFPDLMARVKVLLRSQAGTSEGTHAVEGALAFLDEWFYTAIDENSLLSITRDLFPDLEKLLTIHSFSAQVRCHCISILNQTLETLWMIKEQIPDVTRTVSQELLPRWLDHLNAILATDPSQIIDSCGGFNRKAGEELALQAQAWQTLVTATHFATHLKPLMVSLKETALVSLRALQAPFQLYHVAATDEVEAGDDVSFFATPSSLASKVIDFLGVALQKSKADSDTVTLSLFVPLLCAFSQITANEEEEWLSSVSAFVAAGDDDELGALNNSMRGRCADIVGDLMMANAVRTITALQEAANAAHRSAQAQRNAGASSWWKEEEAVLALIGGVSEYITEHLDESKDGGKTAAFDLENVFSSSVMPYIDKATPHFLYGRCFVFASQFAGVLPTALAMSFLEAAIDVMEDASNADSDGDAIVKLSAVRCVRNFHRHLDDNIVRPHTARILARLAPLLLNASEDVLVLIVETIQAVAVQREGQAENIPPHLFGEMAAASIKAWAKEAMDRILQSAIEDLLEAFAGQQASEAAVCTLQGAAPLLAELLQHESTAAPQDAGKYRSGVVVEGALEFAAALVRGASAEVLIQADFISILFPPLFATLSQSDDREVFSNAATLFSTLVSKIPQTCLAWHDASNTPTVQHILGLVSKMISPEDTSESGGLSVGDLLTTLLRKQPQSLSADLPDICRALVTRLATSSSTSLIQSLVIPLAFLMKDHLETVLRLLLDFTVSRDRNEHEPALELLLRKWLEFAPSVQGFWHARVSALGLCAVFKARTSMPGVAERIDGILIDGDLLPDDVNIIKTRSRAKLMPDRYTQVPVPAKIIKVLIGELRQATDGPPRAAAGGRDAADALTDDEDEEWDDDEDFGDAGAQSQKHKAFLSDMLGEDLDGDLDEVLQKYDEEQYGDDAIWNMDFKSYLENFFRELARDANTASAVAVHLTSEEVTVLRSAVDQGDVLRQAT